VFACWALLDDATAATTAAIITLPTLPYFKFTLIRYPFRNLYTLLMLNVCSARILFCRLPDDFSRQVKSSSAAQMTDTTVLVMIVRNEAFNILHCLNSVRTLVTHWVIVDTGSTDGTQDLVTQHLSHIRGRLIEFTWIDSFAAARNFALDEAKRMITHIGRPHANFLFLDADERIESGAEELASVSANTEIDALYTTLRDEYFDTQKLLLVRASACQKWHGALHETLSLASTVRWRRSLNIVVQYGNTGVRRSEGDMRLKNDVFVLLQSLEHVFSFHTAFHLARTYEALDNLDAAHVTYQAIAQKLHELSAEETWQTIWGLARTTRDDIGDTGSGKAQLYQQLYELDHDRAEPLLGLARIARKSRQWAPAMALADAALSCGYPTNSIMTERGAYGWQALDEMILAAVGSSEGAAMKYALALASRRGFSDAPERDTERITNNVRALRRAAAP
jgi:hypothetical protein